MELTLSTLKERYRVATAADMKKVVDLGNYERPIALLNLITRFISPLTAFIIPQFTLVSFDGEDLLTGFSRGNHTVVRARIRNLPNGGNVGICFEVQDMGPWASPFKGGDSATLYILK